MMRSMMEQEGDNQNVSDNHACLICHQPVNSTKQLEDHMRKVHHYHRKEDEDNDDLDNDGDSHVNNSNNNRLHDKKHSNLQEPKTGQGEQDLESDEQDLLPATR